MKNLHKNKEFTNMLKTML